MNEQISETDPELKVWVLSDGKPGHFNQSRGVIKSLEFEHEVAVEWIDVKLRFNGFRRPMDLLLNSTKRALPLSLLGSFYDLPELPAEQPDLILSAGGNTLYPNAWLARSLGVRNLFVGSIRRLSPSHFWRVLTAFDSVQAENVIQWPITPVPIDPESLQRQGAELRQEFQLENEPLWTCLIGGDGGGYSYDEQDWSDLATALNRLSRAHGIRWLIVSSRRTGTVAEGLLQRHLNPEAVAFTSWYSEEQGERYFPMLGAGEVIWCTEDSHMMMTEAIATTKRVFTLLPKNYSTAPSNQHFIDAYLAENWLQRYQMSELEEHEILNLHWPTPMQESPLLNLGRTLNPLFSSKAA